MRFGKTGHLCNHWSKAGEYHPMMEKYFFRVPTSLHGLHPHFKNEWIPPPLARLSLFRLG